MGQKTQPTVSKHWRKRYLKDQASVPLGPPYCADNNTTYMQVWKKNTKYTNIPGQLVDEGLSFEEDVVQFFAILYSH